MTAAQLAASLLAGAVLGVAGLFTLAILSGLVQVVWDDLHQRAKRRRQGEQQDS